MIAIIDYGMGNLRSVQKGLEKAGQEAVITSDPQVIAAAPGVVLPGVGAFADCVNNLKQAGLVEIIQAVIKADKPFLGICLGLQMLFEYSEEDGLHEGLGIFPGRVGRLPAGLKVPHMGWNQVEHRRPLPILKDVPDQAYFYFVHSYYVQPEDDSIIAGVTDYGVKFTSIVGRGNTFGIQFHPEKSSDLGLKILKNFGELITKCS